MYKTILTATDGSDIAGKAVETAIELAKSVQAKLIAVTVTEPYEFFSSSEFGLSSISPVEYKDVVIRHAGEILADVAEKAKAAGIDCETVHQDNHLPYAGIIKAAEDAGADLIVIGSHGRRGLEGFLIGSVSQKTLTHTNIPTLVVR